MRTFIKYYLFKIIIGMIIIETLFLIWNHYKNNRPEIIASTYAVFSRQILEMDPLSNDIDEDKDSIYINEFNQPLHGKVFQKELLLYYQSNDDFSGIDSFSYVISDGRNKSKPGFIRIEVKENNAPLSLNDTIVLFNSGKNELKILDNDKDLEHDSIYLETISTPMNGKIENINNKLYYTPKANSTGRDSFNYVVNDGRMNSELTKVILTTKSGKFSSDPYFGNASNYTFYNTQNYDILKDKHNDVLAIGNNYNLGWANGAIQEYCIINNRNYNNFELKFKAKATVLDEWMEYAIIFSFIDDSNYNCIHFIRMGNIGRVQAHHIKDGGSQYVFHYDVDLYTDTRFHDIEVQKNAESIIVKFDNKIVVEASDSRFMDEGAIGLGTKAITIYFDDINVIEK